MAVFFFISVVHRKKGGYLYILLRDVSKYSFEHCARIPYCHVFFQQANWTSFINARI